MAVPKKKVTKSKRNMRRSHDQVASRTLTEDQDSGEMRLRHHVDMSTGMYRGRQVFEPKDRF